MNHWEQAKKLSAILAGNALYALAVAFFILPAGLITGGTTGIAIILRHFFGVSVSTVVTVFNLVMFALGAVILGRQFALTTLASTLVYPLFLRCAMALEGRTGPLSQDAMLCTVFAGLLVGLGIALVIQAGASTGGMDIPPLVLHKFTGVSVAFWLYAFDLVILLGQMLFSSREQVLYGILLVCIYSLVLEECLLLGKSQVQVQIISRKYQQINAALLSRLDRGTTLLEAEGGFSRRQMYAILTVVSRRELFRVKELVQDIDPEAFLIIGQVKEVRGRGFTAGKRYAARSEAQPDDGSLG